MTTAKVPRFKELPKGTRITPMLRQYLDAKQSYPDALLLFRMGDFYEMFFEDAGFAAQVLDLTLTSRDKDKGEKSIPMAGFPHHAATSYIARLVEHGFKVAVCDQVEDPKQAKGLVKRAITRVITAGTTMDEEALDARSNNFLAAACCVQEQGVESYGLAVIDVSTGECQALQLVDPLEMVEAVDRLGVAELLADPSLDPALVKRCQDLDSRRRIEKLTQAPELDQAFFAARWPADVSTDCAAGQAMALAMSYVLEVQRGRADQIGSVTLLEIDEHLVLDAATRRHLDLLANNIDGKRRGSLLGALDRCATVMGSRRMARWLAAPSRNLKLIETRQNAVGSLLEAPMRCQDLRDLLRGIPDIERLVARTAAGHATPRDLGALRNGLQQLPGLKELTSAETHLVPFSQRLDTQEELTLQLSRALVPEPPTQTKDGRFIKVGFDDEIDRLTSIAGGAKETLAAVEKRERERTSINSLKVRFNKVFGYFIEVTKTHLAKVPEDYIRKQTIANGERYITEELKQLEDEILHADERRITHELSVFAQLCADVTAAASSLRQSATCIGELDALLGFAETAARWNYVRPSFHGDEDRALTIAEGRHPVLEQLSHDLGEPFVPNDIALDNKQRQVLIVTGPNMAGKSTVMRQVALLQLLAQAGSFVPARSARLPLCDRIFTRVGASDDVSRGRSTFMVEMIETARILSGASEHSLVLLDEIGRGTSTFDGLSIAWAVTEHLHDVLGAKTLFATHYHELTDLARLLDRVVNVHVSVKEWNEEVLFLRRLVDGAAERSYGIQVARLANLPSSVLDRAKEVLANLENAELDAYEMPRAGHSRRHPRKKGDNQLSLFVPTNQGPGQVMDRLQQVDINSTTPMDALTILSELVQLAKK